MEKTLAVINGLERNGIIGRYAIGGAIAATVKRVYPDIFVILAAKARRRRELAVLSWEEKVSIVERMRAALPKGAWKSRTEDPQGAGRSPDPVDRLGA